MVLSSIQVLALAIVVVVCLFIALEKIDSLTFCERLWWTYAHGDSHLRGQTPPSTWLLTRLANTVASSISPTWLGLLAIIERGVRELST
jgi:hypothetical protein